MLWIIRQIVATTLKRDIITWSSFSEDACLKIKDTILKGNQMLSHVEFINKIFILKDTGQLFDDFMLETRLSKIINAGSNWCCFFFLIFFELTTVHTCFCNFLMHYFADIKLRIIEELFHKFLSENIDNDISRFLLIPNVVFEMIQFILSVAMIVKA